MLQQFIGVLSRVLRIRLRLRLELDLSTDGDQ
jgi:hypothetical protein